MSRACSNAGCIGVHYGRGLCRRHYEDWRKSDASRPECSVDDCAKPVASNGWCTMHYQRWKRYGDPNRVVILTPSGGFTAVDRFHTKYEVDLNTQCWVWTSATDEDGYGQFEAEGRNRRAHRYSYEIAYGSIPDELPLDHLCRNPPCVNPEHLEPVTAYLNTARGFGPSADNMRKTHCIWGHEFTEENTLYTKQGWRVCRTCSHRRRQEYALTVIR